MNMNAGIRHMVIFNLKDEGSIDVSTFLKDSKRILSSIPGVLAFEVDQQVSIKNPYQYGFSMFFNNEEAYKQYNAHSEHQKYLDKYWFSYVADFMEIDLVTIESGF